MLMRLSKNTFVRQYGPFTYVLGRIRSYDQMFADAAKGLKPFVQE